MLKTFKRGGVHPPESKYSAQKEIIEISVQGTVSIPMGQHIGAPSTPIVKRGDQVKIGQLIAKSSGFISANIHSPVSGTVKKIDAIADVSGYKGNAIIIDVDGDEWEESIDLSDALVKDTPLDAKEIQTAIFDAGIVGLGGATFPTHVKLMPPPGATAEVLLINAVECEPYLTADHQLMIEKSEEILVGVSHLMKAIGVTQAHIGIENNKPDAIQKLTALAKNYDGIKICPLKVMYPQGGEKQLIDAVIGREIPSGQLPISVGAVVCNVGTAFAVYEAIAKKKPLVERIVTVTGKSVAKPSNFKARIGTPISQLIEAAGGLPEDTEKIISGGPMMGKAITNTDLPMTKGTSGILIMKSDEAHRKPIENCIRCGRCSTACPMGLEPHLLMPLSENQMWDELEVECVMDCIECGSCNYSCPANRPLLDHIRFGKKTVGGIMRSRKKD